MHATEPAVSVERVESARPEQPDSTRRALLLRLSGAAGIAALPLLGGCAAFNYTAPDAPLPRLAPEPILPRPRVALALGSGGPRGYAHIGILRVLEESGIPIDLVDGSSVGALIGAFWAAGWSAADIDRRSFEGGPLTVFDPSPFADRGWIHGQRLQDYVDRGVGGRTIEQLPRRLVVTATHRESKMAYYFDRGRVGVAVRASSAVPGILSPVGIRGIEFEDGDESCPVPVSAARAAGAQFVIAVDVSARPGSTPLEASPVMRERDQRRAARIAPETALADFVLHPDLGYWASPRRSYFVACRIEGEAYARTRLPALQAALAKRGH